MHRSLLLLLTPIYALLSYFPAHASVQQDSTSAGRSLSVAIQPLFAFRNAVKADIELQRSDKPLAWIITPEYYTGAVTDQTGFDLFKNYQGDVLNGFGIGLQQKYKFRSASLSSPYLAYGVQYRYLAIDYNDQGFVPYTLSNLQYYEYGSFNDKLKINSALISAMIGIQTVKKSGILFDCYMGIGYKTANRKSDFSNYRDYDQSPSAYAYKGLLPVLGFKMGYQFSSRN